MKINDLYINADLSDILSELQRQLTINQIPYLQKTKDSGDDIMAQCPYHGNGLERKPSMGIRKSDGLAHCFACHEVHTLPEIISFVFGHDDDMFGKQGMKWLIKNFGTVAVEERKDVEIDVERDNTAHKDTDNSDKPQWVSEEELDSYRYYHKYWKERGIVDEDIIELFDLGFDKETNSITFPVRDVNGNCLFVARRSVKSKMFSYPKGVEKPLYGLYELYTTMPYLGTSHNFVGNIIDLFVTESMIDCILLVQANVGCAVALNGVGSELQYKQLRELPIRHLILATDNDKAGRLAKERIRQNVPNKLITEIEFPDGIKDVGDLGKAKRFDDIKHIRKWEVF